MRKQEQQGIAKAAQLRTQAQGPFGAPGQAWALGGAQEEMFEAMRAALPVDLPVLEVRMVDDRHPAPMAMVRCRSWTRRWESWCG